MGKILVHLDMFIFSQVLEKWLLTIQQFFFCLRKVMFIAAKLKKGILAFMACEYVGLLYTQDTRALLALSNPQVCH